MINDYKKVLTEYFTEFSIDLDMIDIVETSNVDNAYLKLRPDQIGKEQIDSQQYNGFAVAPKDKNGRFTILLNANRMLLSKQLGNFDWVGTVVHEATHIDDHIKYGKIISVESYDDLYDHTKHNMFSCWTEFHARSMGHYYVYKYRKSNNCKTAEEEYILNTEIEQLIDWFNKKDAATDNGYMRLYILMQFLGMLCALQLHYPSVITNGLIGDIFCETKALEELYIFLKDNDSVKKIHSKFDEMYSICKKSFPEMP